MSPSVSPLCPLCIAVSPPCSHVPSVCPYPTHFSVSSVSSTSPYPLHVSMSQCPPSPCPICVPMSPLCPHVPPMSLCPHVPPCPHAFNVVQHRVAHVTQQCPRRCHHYYSCHCSHCHQCCRCLPAADGHQGCALGDVGTPGILWGHCKGIGGHWGDTRDVGGTGGTLASLRTGDIVWTWGQVPPLQWPWLCGTPSPGSARR